MTKTINNKIQTQFSIFFVKVSYSISYYIQSKFIEYLIVIVVNHRGFEIPPFSHIINFSKILLPKYLFPEHELCGYFFTSFGSNDDQLWHFQYFYFELVLAIISYFISSFCRQNGGNGKSFSGFVYITQIFDSCSYLLNTSDLITACISEVACFMKRLFTIFLWGTMIERNCCRYIV